MSRELGSGINAFWRRNRVFRFLASVRLAVVLLVVLTGASIAGTLYESSFNAKVARAYVYGAPWFTVWLGFLVLNLTCSAFSRMPWKRKHVGFLMTHLGIVLMIFGALIGRYWGIEGTMTLFEGEPARNSLVIDEHVLKVTEGAEGRKSTRSIPVEILNRKPSSEKPWLLGSTRSGYSIAITGKSPAVVEMTPRASSNPSDAPAIHIAIKTAMMGQTLQQWLLADDTDAGRYDMGLASIELRRGTAPAISPSGAAQSSAPSATHPEKNSPVEIKEAIFAFANIPEQVSKPLKGGRSGIKIKLEDVTADSGGTLVVQYNGNASRFQVSSIMHQSISLPGTSYRMHVDDYWPDFRLRDGKPISVSDEPNNPAVLATIEGQGVPLKGSDDPHGLSLDGKQSATADTSTPGMPPAMGSESSRALNRLTLYVDEQGRITYQLSSRKKGESSGRIEPGGPGLPTGWADWALSITEFFPHAAKHSEARPVASDSEDGAVEAVRVRVSKGADRIEEWVPLDWHTDVPVEGEPLQVGYEVRQEPLPISLKLLNFEVERNEGNDSPAGFKSTLEITNMDGEKITGQCWMNHPFSYPGSWLNTLSGLTYKISQASWNPDNPSQSTVQILRDPGWGLKWIGSLCIVSGIFSLFYLRPVRGQPRGRVNSPKAGEAKFGEMVS